MFLYHPVTEMIVNNFRSDVSAWRWNTFFCPSYERIMIVQENNECSKREIMHATAWFSPDDRAYTQDSEIYRFVNMLSGKGKSFCIYANIMTVGREHSHSWGKSIHHCTKWSCTFKGMYHSHSRFYANMRHTRRKQSQREIIYVRVKRSSLFQRLREASIKVSHC